MNLAQFLPVQPDLFAALALNAAELDHHHRQQQARVLLQTLGPAVPPPPAPAPLAYEPAPEAAAWQRNLKGFLRLFSGTAQSRNPYNNHAFFATAPVLKSGWGYAPATLKQAVEAPPLGRCGGAGPAHGGPRPVRRSLSE